MIEAWRWFGPNDPISLEMVKQAGATDIVSSLHEVAVGEAWSLEKVKERQELIEAAGLRWSIVESLPVSEEIKIGGPKRDEHIASYVRSLEVLAEAQLRTICYNFMPVIDWTRTNLNHEMPNGAMSLRFDIAEFAAYDCFILERPGAFQCYSREVIDRAESLIKTMSADDIELLEENIIAGLPGGQKSLDRQAFVALLDRYAQIGDVGLRENLKFFLRAVVPVAERLGLRLAVHPDDPPFSLLGLPRIVSNEGDIAELLAMCVSPANGLTLCAGSLGSSRENDLVSLVRKFAPFIRFVHLRNVQIDDDGSFCETDHLGGDHDLVAVVQELLKEEAERSGHLPLDAQIPFRPDHGLLFGSEQLEATTNPGYSYLGRLRGLAELRGVIAALSVKGSLGNRHSSPMSAND